MKIVSRIPSFLIASLFATAVCALIDGPSGLANPTRRDRSEAKRRTADTQPESSAADPKETKSDTKVLAAKLLDRAPILDPLPADALSERDFLESTGKLLNKNVKDINDAIKELEEVLANKKRFGNFSFLKPVIRPVVRSIMGPQSPRVGSVTAAVTSSPSSLNVRYFRVSHPKNKLDTVTDNQRIQLDPPAIWVFECSRNGQTQTKKVSCTGGCSVHFSF